MVTPILGEGKPWSSTDGAALDYARHHWLDGLRRLRPLPEGFAETRGALHQIAYFALAPKRHAAIGKMGLRYTRGGFGTPFFGDDEQVRVEDGTLAYQKEHTIRATAITTVAAATSFLGVEYRRV